MTEEKKPEVKETSKVEKTSYSIRDMLKAGVHFGHKTLRWNAKMAPYIYGEKNKLHIIDLTQTSILLKQAVNIVHEVAKAGGKILFVSTKKQAGKTIAEEATRCGQPYVNNKWLGGMLTNWQTIKKSLKTLRETEEQLENTETKLLKKEKLMLSRKKDKIERNLGGIKNMGRYPDLLFVIDTNRESIAIAEAKNLGIPVMAIVDTNSNPDLIDYPIPGNDDSIKAIKLYCKVLADAISEGVEQRPVNKPATKGKVKKFSGKKKTAKAPIKKAEEKTPAVKKETKAPVKKAEAKVPATKKKAETPAVKKEKKAPAVKKEAKAPAKAKK
jgi:small subunit ribosomal protein S2